MVKLITLLRHGEVDARDDIFRGSAEHELTKKGWQSMRKSMQEIQPSKKSSGRVLSRKITRMKVDFLVTSPRIRCVRFAEQYKDDNQLPWKIDKEIAEMDFGDWEEQTFEKTKISDPKQYSLMYQNPERFHPPNGEKYLDFQKRTLSAFNRIKTLRINHVVIITHAGVISHLVSHVCGDPAKNWSKYYLPYGGYGQIKKVSGKWKVTYIRAGNSELGENFS